MKVTHIDCSKYPGKICLVLVLAIKKLHQMESCYYCMNFFSFLFFVMFAVYVYIYLWINTVMSLLCDCLRCCFSILLFWMAWWFILVCCDDDVSAVTACLIPQNIHKKVGWCPLRVAALLGFYLVSSVMAVTMLILILFVWLLWELRVLASWCQSQCPSPSFLVLL